MIEPHNTPQEQGDLDRVRKQLDEPVNGVALFGEGDQAALRRVLARLDSLAKHDHEVRERALELNR